MKSLPYQAVTSMGDQFHIDFPLHPDTGDPVRVSQLVSVVLDAVGKDIAVMGETSNGDVLQAITMAMAIRARMLHGSHDVVSSLSLELLSTALEAVEQAPRESNAGHA